MAAVVRAAAVTGVVAATAVAAEAAVAAAAAAAVAVGKGGRRLGRESQVRAVDAGVVNR